MKARLLAAALFLVGILCIVQQAHSQLTMTGVGGGAPGSGSGCSQATTFLARTSGLSGTETTAYTNLICGMVTDGNWSSFDLFYIFTTNTTTTAKLNLVSTSFSLTQNGTATFTADTGWAGDGSTGYLDPSYTPSSNAVNCTLNSCSAGVYDLTNRAISTAYSFGNADGTSGISLAQWFTVNGLQENINASGGETGIIVTGSNGFFQLSRTGSTAETIFQNGANVTGSPFTNSSTALPTNDLFIMTRDVFGTPSGFSGDQYTAFYLGAGRTNAQLLQISNRINAFMTVFGVNQY